MTPWHQEYMNDETGGGGKLEDQAIYSFGGDDSKRLF